MNISFNNEIAILSLHFETVSVHIGVKPQSEEVYSYKNCNKIVNITYWMWGRFIEPYDLCLRYYGFGPLMLICVPN